MSEVHFRLNGEDMTLEVQPKWTLLYILREVLHLTGTKCGCGTGNCGTCTVVMNGEAVRSCLINQKKLEGADVTTIEGLADGEKLHPIQQAFIDAGAVQCGFCIPGMIMAAKALLDKDPDPDEMTVRKALDYNLCRCTVLRLGEVAGSLNIADTNCHELATLMVGKPVDLTYDKAEIDPASQTDVLKLEGVKTKDEGVGMALKGLDLTIKSGEILGIAGVDGNGQDELVDSITGLRAVEEGHVYINGKDLTGAHPDKVLKEGVVSHIPADRIARGIIMPMNLSENIYLMNSDNKEFQKGIFLDWGSIDKYAIDIIKKYNVKTPSHQEYIQNLSGGNQQKVVLGRELERAPKLLIAMHPARGLDIGATQFVQEKIVEERDRGAAVLLVSTELEEIRALSDRIAVMYEGQIMGIVPPDAPIYEISLMMAGIRYEDITEEDREHARAELAAQEKLAEEKD